MKKIELVEIRQVNDALAEMVALFRVELRHFCYFGYLYRSDTGI